MKTGSRHSEASRAKISAATRAHMADPAVRERIKAGMAAADPQKREHLRLLRSAWASAQTPARREFLAEIIDWLVQERP